MRAYVCQTPSQFCSGATYTSTGRLGSVKAHKSPQEAYRCYSRHLVHNLGYIAHPNREFAPPDGGPRLVLTKPSRYGGAMHKGKTGGEGKGGKRVTPRTRSGVLIVG